MPTPLLATKLYIPPPRQHVVRRSRLTERLHAGLHRKLTLISAPAGFGKSTLLSAWVTECGRPAAWLSLDAGENDPTRFLLYLVAALQTVAPTIGEGILRVLQSPQPPPIDAILTALLNDITTLPDPFLLVLDDYHVIDAQPIDQALTFLVEHLPPQLHLVIATREDPPLPLARFRARGQSTELRATDLRFTATEAAAFLTEVMGLDLSADDIAALDARTEGWIAGLQLAALSMQGRSDTAGFIQAFTGSHRFVLDYLVEEVLQHQPERVRCFLSQTALLDRLTGPLCDAVTGQEDDSGTLEALERGNLFVIPLDDTRQWYRYHHLFAEVLQARLREEQPEQVPALHRRASAWYEQNGLRSDAIRHALIAEDFGRAAGLVELETRAMLTTRQDETLRGWLKALPDELVRARPVLSAYYAVALLAHDLEASEDRLRDAERSLDGTARISERPEAPSAPMVVVDEEEFRSLPGITAITRAYHAGALGDVSGSVTYARRALDLLPEDDHLWRGAAAALLGDASWTSGELETAYRFFVNSMASLRMTGDITQLITGAFILADIRTAQGRLREAERLYEQALQLAVDQGESMPPKTADLYVGMSELRRERNDLDGAVQDLLKSKEMGAHSGLSENRYRWYVAMARIKEAQGDFGGALDLLDEAERLYIRSPNPYVRPVAARKARVWMRQGRLAEVLEWAREAGLSSGDDLSYVREFEHITLARVLIARYTSDRVDSAIHEAMSLLERLLQAADEGGRMGSVIEILVLHALAYEAQSNDALALAPLSRALVLAESEGYVRIFLDEGTSVAVLLEKAAKHGIGPNYVRHLLTALGKAEDRTPGNQVMIEPLSERERDVLRLLATNLTGPEIARELMVSPSTMRTHTSHIYGKLGVNSRRAAVRRAEELALL
jgi:LuxR family transcriptional regulator, maltose regulon positive regulatory protein